MPIISVTSPANNSLNAAYNPVIVEALGSSAMPIVYCDIYFNNVFYKTLSKTLANSTNGNTSAYQFDIQDACQEVFANIDSYFIGVFPGIVTESKVICSCMLRGSSLDANGLTVPDGVPPIQGTGGSAPVSGSGGIITNSFFLLNAALQITDDPDLVTHLNRFKIGDWSSDCFPLTHRTVNYIGLTDNDTFPVFLTNDYPNAKIAVRYKLFGQTTDHIKVFSTTSTATGTTVLVAGPANFLRLGFDMKNVDSYKVELWSQGGDTLATSPIYRIKSFCDYKRIWFKNSLGQFDGLNFLLSDITHSSSSSSWQRSETYGTDYMLFGTRRIGVIANDTYTGVCAEYGENDMEFIQELLETIFAYTTFQDNTIPIVIYDQKLTKFQEDNRYLYNIKIQFGPSIKRKTLRS